MKVIWRRETRDDTKEENRVFILVMSSCLHGCCFQLEVFVSSFMYSADSTGEELYRVSTSPHKDLRRQDGGYVSSGFGDMQHVN